MPSPERKFLFFPVELKSIGADGIVEGYASTFGNIDQGGDVVDPGAFKKTIKESKAKWPILSNHNPYAQIGWNLEAQEDEKGLWVRGKYDIENNAKAKEHYSLIKMAQDIGAKAGLSIGYYPIKAEPDKENPTVRRLKELKLFEYSPVTFPMNTEARATSAKSAMQSVIDNLETDDLVGLEELAKIFLETLEKKGYSDEEVKKALGIVRAAALPVEADPVASDQSFIDEMKSLTELFSPKGN